ncbi:MAG: S41 family peptidase [Cyclobacteriaceae bacterium]
MESAKNRNDFRLPLYIAAAIALGIFIGAQTAGGGAGDAVKTLYKLRQVISYIENDYVDEVDTRKLVDQVIVDMLEKLDPHSAYIPPKDLEIRQSQLKGNFEGIGVEFNIFKDTVFVVAPLSGGPSERLGIMSGDRIIKVDGQVIAGVGFTNRDVVELLRGEKGSEVEISIMRKGTVGLIDYTIERDVIPQYSVDANYMIDGEIGYIKVSRFSATTYMEFKEALIGLKDQGMKKLILDLTGNPGGYLDRAVDMVDEFLSDNQMIVYTEGKESRYNDSHISKREGDFEEGALIVLIDEGSASASEIVAGALQDHDRALIVGRRSFGKGLVQLPISLNDGSELHLTISRYYTPSGRSIQKSYDGGVEDYRKEYYERFQSGEVYNGAAGELGDTVIYKTDQGRIVYGGGGITPDHFVPIDTAGNSKYLNQLLTSNSLAEYALHYYEENSETLKSMGRQSFVDSFEVSADMIREIVKAGESNNIIFNANEYDTSEQLMKIYVKAFIGRRVWDNEAFFPIFNKQNEIYQKALELFDQAASLASAEKID